MKYAQQNSRKSFLHWIFLCTWTPGGTSGESLCGSHSFSLSVALYQFTLYLLVSFPFVRMYYGTIEADTLNDNERQYNVRVGWHGVMSKMSRIVPWFVVIKGLKSIKELTGTYYTAYL